MLPGSPHALIDEMLQVPELLRHFDHKSLSGWAERISAKKSLFVTGEGSSRIFPAKNMIDLALRAKTGWRIHTEGARQAAEYDLSDFIILGASNSGRTRELIALFEGLADRKIPSFGITPAAESPLAKVAGDARILSCGAEKAVAATKSVVEQALTWQALLQGGEWRHQAEAAGLCADILAQDIAPGVIEAVSDAEAVYFAGRNNGVAEELALKANEITRKKSLYLEGTYALHGIEEVMQPGETVVLVEPFRAEMEKYQSVLSGAGVKTVAIASFDTPFPTVRIPSIQGFDGYLQLMAGWNVLVAAGLAQGVDLDKPARARKIGNSV